MEGTALLLLPQGLHITTIERQETGLLIQVHFIQMTCRCPLCGAESNAVHSRYQCRIADLPCAGQSVCLRLSVRKFFCHNPHCARKIFTERLPTFVEPWAQMTVRLKEAASLPRISNIGKSGHATFGTIGHNRLMDDHSPPPQGITPSHTSRGFRGFASTISRITRGRTFGTILVDLSAHQVLDLLEDANHRECSSVDARASRASAM